MPDDDEAAEDERLLAELRGDDRPGPMPAGMRASVHAAFAKRRADSMFADVHEDSADTPHQGLRDTGDFAAAPRYVCLRAAGVEVRLEITASDGRRDIVGRLTPPGAPAVEVRCPYRVTRHEVDADGAFVVRGVPKGPVSLVFQRRGRAAVTTRWMAV
ncbi:hypothetical protein [Allosalinactinospora lopnorensis]|uniref:hypothetical protein n=1 Tax=Allosalinactinospora lopnorensis TaxID=1352348 RepID=UPI000623EB1B|nr:hypothetical protein [Allosalinactinospora lopnorensis]